MPSRPALGSTQPSIQRVPEALSLGVKQPGRETDHSSPASTQVKKTWVYTSTPPYVFKAYCLIKHRDNFTFKIEAYIPVLAVFHNILQYLFQLWYMRIVYDEIY
jgi:hypothetical protein